MGLTNIAIEKVSSSHAIIGLLADAFGNDPKTIRRWTDKNDEMLTTVKALSIIEKETGLTKEEILENIMP